MVHLQALQLSVQPLARLVNIRQVVLHHVRRCFKVFHLHIFSSSWVLPLIRLFRLARTGCWGASGATSSCPNTCPAGQYSTGGAVNGCTNCPAGQYQTATNSPSCIQATAGYYTTSTTTQALCPAGQYSTGTFFRMRVYFFFSILFFSFS